MGTASPVGHFASSTKGFALRVVGAVAVLAFAASTGAAPVRTEHVEAELVAARTAIVPGEPLTVALRLAIDKGWHTYWRNPGDSGLPTTLEWKLPAGMTAGPIEWPAPRALPTGPLVNYGYEGEVLHLVELKAAPTLAAERTATIAARADWLVCRETCIPEGADLTLVLPIAATAGPDPRWGAPIAAAQASLPRPLAGWQASAEGRGATIALKLAPPADAADPGTILFFANAIDRVEPSKPQLLSREGASYVLTLPVASTLAGPFGRLAGVVTATNGFAPDARAATIDVAVNGAVVAGPKAALAPAPVLDLTPPSSTGDGMSLGLALAFALVGGLILNLMPCVFPVLSLKVLGFATHHDARSTLKGEAIAFAGGVVLTFVVLGLLLAALRAAGEQLGWGFQLQSPAVVAALAILFFVLALNLSGIFEFGMVVPSALAEWSSKNRVIDAFGSGVLAVVIASPCTAPFMGAALGFALAGSTALMLTVFVALGAGMALPYVLLAWFPGWRERLPRPGPWLARLKELLAFPLYGTVIWLAWVLGAQRDNDAILRLFVALLGIGFALWAWRIVRGGGARPWGLAGVAVLACAAIVAWPLFADDPDSSPHAAATASDGEWTAFAPARVAELTAAGRPVFVDFTAAWCVTCQVNKRLVLNTDTVRSAFAKRNVALLRADWTRRDPMITRALTELGRSGVPVYVLYRPGKTPLLLPEVLQPQVVLDALATLGP
jgi:thiol:disulfide interchange protein/DsbC/DsbD-like thiol-disulfide interchange protein